MRFPFNVTYLGIDLSVTYSLPLLENGHFIFCAWMLVDIHSVIRHIFLTNDHVNHPVPIHIQR